MYQGVAVSRGTTGDSCLTLYVDDREPIQIITELRKRVDNVVTGRYDSGDYVFGEVGIERKSLSDALASLHDGRYFRQIKELKDHYKKPLVLFEGDIDNTTLVRFFKIGKKKSKQLMVFDESEKKQIREMQHGTVFGWVIPVIQSTCVDDTVTRIAEIYNREMGYKVSTPPSPVTKKSQEVDEIKYLMLNCINGIGPTLAKRVLKVAPTFTGIRGKGAKVLSSDVKGLTLDKAKLLVEAIQ